MTRLISESNRMCSLEHKGVEASQNKEKKRQLIRPSWSNTVASSKETSINKSQRITEGFLAELREKESPYWQKFRKLKRINYKNIEAAVKTSCTIAYNLFSLTGSEASGIVIKLKKPRTKNPYGFTGPLRGISGYGIIDLMIPKGTVYMGWYHSHDASGPSPVDHDKATQTNLPLFMSHQPSGRIALYQPIRVSQDQRLYKYVRDIGKVNLIDVPLRFHSDKPLDRQEQVLWKQHLNWRIHQMGHWVNDSRKIPCPFP